MTGNKVVTFIDDPNARLVQYSNVKGVSSC